MATFTGNNRFTGILDISQAALIGIGANPCGKFWYVDSVNGTIYGSGKSWSSALSTIAAAVALASAGDTICIIGSFTEVVTVSLAGLSIIGMGTGPNMSIWTSAVDTAPLTFNANNCLVGNIKIRPAIYSSSTTYGPCGIYLSSANYAKIRSCRFQGQANSYNAIYSPVCNSDNVEISDCEFIYMNTLTNGCAILGVEAGGLCYSDWRILRNRFSSNVTNINIAGRACQIKDNDMPDGGITALGAVGTVLTLGMDLSGTNSGGNTVTRNTLGGAYTSTLWKCGASGDNWMGNYAAITTTSAPYGLSVTTP